VNDVADVHADNTLVLHNSRVVGIIRTHRLLTVTSLCHTSADVMSMSRRMVSSMKAAVKPKRKRFKSDSLTTTSGVFAKFESERVSGFSCRLQLATSNLMQ